MIDGWIKRHQTCMDIGSVIPELSYFNIYIYIYIVTIQGKTMVEDAQRKFTVWKARSWRVFKPKVHNLIVNETKEKLEILQSIYSFIYLSFTLLIVALCFSYHHQNFITQVKFFKSIQKVMIMAIYAYRLKITFEHSVLKTIKQELYVYPCLLCVFCLYISLNIIVLFTIRQVWYKGASFYNS